MCNTNHYPFKYIHFIHLRLIILLIITNICFSQSEEMQINYYSGTNILRFADYLYQTKDFIRAATEYERFIFIKDSIDKEYLASLYYQIGMCYQQSSSFNKALKYFFLIQNEFPNSTELYKSYYQSAVIYSLIGEYDKSNTLISDFFSNKKVFNKYNNMKYLVGINHMRMHNWEYANNYFDNLGGELKNSNMTIKLKGIAIKGVNLNRKNVYISGILSALLPGAGKIYNHRLNEGITSLLHVGLFALATYKSYERVDGWTLESTALGLTTLVFYTGNIVGSISAARIYNTYIEKSLLEEIPFLSFTIDL